MKFVNLIYKNRLYWFGIRIWIRYDWPFLFLLPSFCVSISHFEHNSWLLMNLHFDYMISKMKDALQLVRLHLSVSIFHILTHKCCAFRRLVHSVCVCWCMYQCCQSDQIASILEFDWLNDWFLLLLLLLSKNKMRLKLEIEMLAYDWLDSILLPPHSTDAFLCLNVDNGFKSRKVFMRSNAWTSSQTKETKRARD